MTPQDLFSNYLVCKKIRDQKAVGLKNCVNLKKIVVQMESAIFHMKTHIYKEFFHILLSKIEKKGPKSTERFPGDPVGNSAYKKNTFLCRGSYNLDLLDDKEPPAIHTISINESRC